MLIKIEMLKKLNSVIGLFLIASGYSWSQSFIMPNYGLKSHETLLINKIETTSKATTFFLSVENRIQGGTFCADKNIYLIYPDGTKSRLITTTGIPVCPEAYKFSAPGEKLDFTLVFPPLKQGVQWVDLIEDCYENCFYFYGLTLDNDLNQKIDNAFALAENEETVKALISFIDLLEAIDSKNAGAEGLLYVNVIKLSKDSGNATQASQWYKRLRSSEAPRSSQYIKFLNDQGIKY
jgi:hypothetical protein